MTVYLLDTNIVSEPTKPRPNQNVLAWLKVHGAEGCYLSTVTIAEIVRGVEKAHRKLPAKGQSLAAWLAGIETEFKDRILAFDQGAAHEWGRLMAEHQAAPFDTMIAAQARARNFTVVTQNAKDFIKRKVPVIDPSKPAA